MIDYERLAKAVFTQEIDNGISDEISEAWESGRGWQGVFKEEVARAVVAALAEQGLVVIENKVLRGLVDAAERPRPVYPPYLDAAKAALVEPGDGGEDS